MTDIVERLKYSLSASYSELRKEAAVEIMRLRNRIEAAEKERDEVAQQLVRSEIGKREISEAHNAVTRRLSVLADENTALRAKIAEMEKQEPIGEIVAFGEFLHEPSWKRGKLPHLGTKLYALPGVELVVTPKMEQAFYEKVEVTSIGSIRGLADGIKAAMLAAAPEAKP